MKYFSMIGSINSEMLSKFIEFYNANAADDWTIILNSQGGDYWQAEALIRMINDHRSTTTMIIQGVYSMGFFIAANVECKKILSKTSRGMFHCSAIEISIDERTKPQFKEGKCILKDLHLSKEISENLANKVMTGSELRSFKKGNDVFFGHKRMVQIFTHATIM